MDDDSAGAPTPAQGQGIQQLLQRAPPVPGSFANWPGFNVTQHQGSGAVGSTGTPAAHQMQPVQGTDTSSSATPQQLPLQQGSLPLGKQCYTCTTTGGLFNNLLCHL